MTKDADAFSKDLIELLKKERLSRGLTHEKLAELSGLSRQAIGKIEAGERTPSIKNVYKMVIAMEMTMVDFLKQMEK